MKKINLLKKFVIPTLAESFGVCVSYLMPVFLDKSLSAYTQGLQQRGYFFTKNIIYALAKKRDGVSTKTDLDAGCFNAGVGFGLTPAACVIKPNDLISSTAYGSISVATGFSCRTAFRFFQDPQKNKIKSIFFDKGGKEIASLLGIVTIGLGANPNVAASAYWVGAGYDSWKAHKEEHGTDSSFVKFLVTDSKAIVPTQVSINLFLNLITWMADTSVSLLQWQGIGVVLPLLGILHAWLQVGYKSFTENNFSNLTNEPDLSTTRKIR